MMRKAVLLIIAIAGVLMMSDFGQRNSPDSAGAAGGPGVSTARRVFLGQPHVGRFVVSRVAQTPKRHESHIAGLFIVPYQVTLQVKEALPPVGRALFVTNGAKGEGPEAGAKNSSKLGSPSPASAGVPAGRAWATSSPNTALRLRDSCAGRVGSPAGRRESLSASRVWH